MAKRLIVFLLLMSLLGLGSVHAESLNQSPHILLDSLQKNSAPGINVSMIPFFRGYHDPVKHPLFLKLTVTGSTGHVTEFDVDSTALRSARTLYDEHLEFLEMQPSYIWGYIYSVGLKDEAYPYLMKALESNTPNLPILYCATSYLVEKGDIDTALTLIDNYINGVHTTGVLTLPYVYLMKAWLLLDQDQVDLAIDAAKNADELIKGEPIEGYPYPEAKFLEWFLPLNQSSSIKVGVFINGKPQENILVLLDEAGQPAPEKFYKKEARSTKKDGYTGSFLRSPGHYTCEVRLTPEQGLRIEKGYLNIVVRGRDGKQVASFLDRKNIMEPGKIYTSYDLEPYIDLQPGEHIFVEYHIDVAESVEITASKTTYNVEDSILLTWDKVPGSEYYKLEILDEEFSSFIDVFENRVVLNENFVNSLFKYDRVKETDFGPYLHLPLGFWRSVDTLELRVVAYTSKEEAAGIQIHFPTYLNEQAERNKSGYYQFKLNKESLQPWELEILKMPLFEAYQYFNETFTTEEIQKDPWLQAVYSRLRRNFETTRARYYIGDEKEIAREQARYYIELGMYEEALKIYLKLLRSDREKVYLDAFLCDLTDPIHIIPQNYYTQLSKDPDYQLVAKREWHDDYEIEREFLPQIAVAILNEDLEIVESFLSELTIDSVFYNKIKALLNLVDRYTIYVD